MLLWCGSVLECPLSLEAYFLSAQASSRPAREFECRRQGPGAAAACGIRAPDIQARVRVALEGRGRRAGHALRRVPPKVPLSTYEDLAPHIELMKKGEPDVLWPGRCQIYAVSSGTTAGRTKYIPVTEAMLDHFRQCGLDSLLWYTARVGHPGIFRGRHLFLGGSTTLAPIPESEPFEAYAGDLSGIAALNLPRWVEKPLLRARGRRSRRWPTGPRRSRPSPSGRPNRRHLAPGGDPQLDPDPRRLSALEHDPRQGPGGAPPGHLAELRVLRPRGRADSARSTTSCARLLGPTVNFHEVYPASEGFIAAQDAESAAGLRLMADAGIFYEFLPMWEFDEARIPTLGEKAVPIDGVKAGRRLRARDDDPGGLGALPDRRRRPVRVDEARRGSTTWAGRSSS